MIHPICRMCVDLIGQWIVQVRKNPYEFSALTAIDTVTNLVELIRADDKTSEKLQESMRNVGYHVIHGRKDVCMTLGQNLLDPNSKHF